MPVTGSALLLDRAPDHLGGGVGVHATFARQDVLALGSDREGIDVDEADGREGPVQVVTVEQLAPGPEPREAKLLVGIELDASARLVEHGPVAGCVSEDPVTIEAESSVAGEGVDPSGVALDAEEPLAHQGEIGLEFGPLDRPLGHPESAVPDPGAASELFEESLAVGTAAEAFRGVLALAQDHLTGLEARGVHVGEVVGEHAHLVLGAGDAVALR